MRTSMPVLPVKTGKGRQETISVGPIGIAVMVCFWYPMFMLGWAAIMLTYWLIRLIVWVCVASVRALRQRRQRKRIAMVGAHQPDQ